MIVAAKKGDEEIEVRRLSRRGFLEMLAGGAAAAIIPKKIYFFFGGIHRPSTDLVLPVNIHQLMIAGSAVCAALLIGGFGLRR